MVRDQTACNSQYDDAEGSASETWSGHMTSRQILRFTSIVEIFGFTLIFRITILIYGKNHTKLSEYLQLYTCKIGSIGFFL